MPLDAKHLDRYLTSEDRFSGSGPVIKYGPHVGRIASVAEVIISKMRTPYDDSATDSDRQHDIDLIAAAILAERQRCPDACTLSAREVELLYSAETARYIAGKIAG